MRVGFPFVLVVGLLMSTVAARAQGRWPEDALMYPEHSIKLEQNSTDDYLISMADAANINVLTDTTRFPASVPQIQGEWQNNWSSASNGEWRGGLLSFFLAFSSERELTWTRYAPRTFLLWSAPGAQELANIGRQICALRPRRVATSAGIMRRDADEKAMDLLLANFYKEQYKWDGASQEVAPDLKLSQLPPELRAKVMAIILERVQHVDLIDQGFWYEDAFWQHATLQIRKQFPRDNFRFLCIGGKTDPEREFSAINYGGLQAIDDPRLGISQDPDIAAFAKAHAKKPQPAAKPAAPAVAEVAPAPEVPGPKITLTLKQRPISELLDAAQQQAGVTLSAAPNAVDAAARVTLSVHAMPLSEFTQALSGLYGVRWKTNAAGGLEMLPALSPLDVKIDQMGYLDMFRYWTNQPRRDIAPDNLQLPTLTNWFEEITETVDPNDLTGYAKDWAVEGVPVADLPPELQAKIRLHMEGEVAVQEIRRYSKERDALSGISDDSILHVAPMEIDDHGVSFNVTGTGANKKFTILKPEFARTAHLLAPDGRLISGISFASPIMARERERQQKFDAMNARMQELSANHKPGTPVGPPPPPGVLP